MGEYESVEEAVATYKSENASEVLKAQIQKIAEEAAKRRAAKESQSNKDSAYKPLFWQEFWRDREMNKR